MSRLEHGRGITDADQIHLNLGTEQEKNVNEPTLRTSPHQLSENSHAREDINCEESDIYPVKAPQSLAEGKSAEIAKAGDGEAPELDRARIEHMGRERPTKFKSLGRELTFCYSIIASQFMSVRAAAATLLKGEH